MFDTIEAAMFSTADSQSTCLLVVFLVSTAVIAPDAAKADDEEDDDDVPLPVQTGPTDVHGGWGDDDDEEEEDEDEEDAEEDDDDSTDLRIDVAWNETHSDEAPFELLVGGYLRFGYTSIQNDPDVDFIGRRDGFLLHDAKLELDGQLKNGLGFLYEMDVGVDEQAANSSDAAVPLNLQLDDVTIYYEPFDWLRADVGQFKPGFDVEEQISTSDLLFIYRSVGARGISGVEGYNVDGLALQRQLGVRLRGGPYFPTSKDGSPSGPGGSLQLSATNGQEANLSLNDNEHLAYTARAGLHWGKYVRLGAAYHHNNETIGTRPDRLGVQHYGWTADITAEFRGATLIGSIIRMNTDPESGARRLGQSVQVQAAYEEPFIGLQPAYRFAMFDPTFRIDGNEPNAGSPADVDQRIRHTIGLNYRAKGYPLVLMANYTIAQESEQRQLTNNRFDALLQLSW